MKADELQVVLLTRLRDHIKQRIKDEKVRDHWCLGWAAKNMAHMADVMILFNPVKDEYKCLDSNIALLKSNNDFVSAEGDESDKQGAYMYFDQNNYNWI